MIVCDHGHPRVENWTSCSDDECWYGHPARHELPEMEWPQPPVSERLLITPGTDSYLAAMLVRLMRRGRLQ